MSPAPRFAGSHVKRVEDPRLIQGQAQYLDGLALPGLLHLVFVRSPHAHARLAALDAAPARGHPGAAAVLTAEDVAWLAPKPVAFQPPGLRLPPRAPLARDAVPTSVNPLGAKGAGKAGSVGAPPAIVNAVLDALAPFGVRSLDMPLRAERVWAALRAAR